VDVAAAPRAAGGDQQRVAVGREVAEQVSGGGVENSRSDRHPDGEVVPAPPLLPAAGPMLAVDRGEPGALDERRKVVEIPSRLQDDVAAAPAIATIRTALRFERLRPKGRRAAAAATRADTQRNRVSEHCVPLA